MREELVDKISADGLDTLSERALRRLTDGWTGGELHSVDTLDYNRENVASEKTFDSIIEFWRKARERYHEADADSVFGAESRLGEGVEPIADSLAVSGAEYSTLPDVTNVGSVAEGVLGMGDMITPLYNVLIALIVIYYMFCVYRYFDDIVAIFSSVFNRNMISSERASERRHSDIFYGSLGKLFLLGVCFVGLVCGLWCRNFEMDLPLQVLLWMPFAVMASFLVVIVFQYMLLMAIGFVTRSVGEVSSLLRIRLIYFVLASVVVSPILLISQMGTTHGYQVWQNVGFVAAVVAVGLFFRESLKLFISKKVSILHWILYLCAVEIMPITLLWQVVVRLS